MIEHKESLRITAKYYEPVNDQLRGCIKDLTSYPTGSRPTYSCYEGQKD
jgi:hypothetical protein